jgi:tetratricopeptide (TPR) repeat protein
MTRFRGILVGLVVTLASPAALGEPTFWQRITNRRAHAEAKLLESLERTLDGGRRADVFELGLDREFARGAVAMVELAGLSEPRDPTLACVFAQALVEADIGREADARRLLESAIEKLPEGTRAASAWNALAIALGRIDEPKAQRQAYTRVIELTWDPETRALSYYNRGEVKMRERDLTGARADYEESVLGARDPSLVALARYGLAVAEERLGDLPKAYAALEKAALVKLPVPPYPAEDPLDLPSVFFVPVYEENYLRALRAMAIGRRATDERERADAFETAVAEWDIYLARAPEDEPFRQNAVSHRARCERELEKPAAARRR